MGGKKGSKGAKGAKGTKGSGYLSPGVYVDESPAGAKPIEGVGTAVAAFVGLAPRRPARLVVSALLALVLGSAVARALSK